LSGRAKDAGSAAVFLSAVNMGIVWGIILFDLIFNYS
ncbi:MAG TPA: diacylglycerol kinase, partial [Deltaproteobacteria bacterium]|nr:diacylglycerol kinase [Deltaproteobacteria bacterium]